MTPGLWAPFMGMASLETRVLTQPISCCYLGVFEDEPRSELKGLKPHQPWRRLERSHFSVHWRLFSAELVLMYTVLQRVWFAPGCCAKGRKKRLPEMAAKSTIVV